MKRIISKIMMAASVVLLLSCGDDNETSQRDRDIASIAANAWGDPVVDSSDGDLSEDYADFVMVFTKSQANGFEGSFVISNGSYGFTETSGHWTLTDDLNKMVFDSGKEMDYDLIDGHLILHFEVADPGGRIDGLSGQFTFELKPI
ncbi:MAG: hypothetical protein HC859_06650 [Bacteroidia bacterium]|nr:hypothetical protein [Bacteroidia bacterium]